MDINKMTLDELKDYLQKMKESLDEEYEIWAFFVDDDGGIFPAEICPECGGIIGQLEGTINPDILKDIDIEALGIEIRVASRTEDCMCQSFLCENCCAMYEKEELFKKITVDGEEYCFCSEDCYLEWKENNEDDGDDDEDEEDDEDDEDE